MMPHMKKILSLLLTFALAACSKEVLQPVEQSLGCKTVEAAAGSFQVLVTADAVWEVSTEDDWIDVAPGWHRSASAFVVNYASNESIEGACRFNRTGHIAVKTYDGALVGVLELRQKGIDPFIEFTQCEYGLPAAGGICDLALRTNLGDAQRASIRVDAQAAWLEPSWGRDGRSVRLQVQAGSNRSASVRVQFTDCWGQVTEAACTVTQN